MTRKISNMDDVIDSRDVIARIEELQDERADLIDGLEGAETEEEKELAKSAIEDWDTYNAAELAALQGLAEEASGCADDWECGETLIRDSYFTDYAEELMQDIGDLPRDIPGYIVIDWESTARNIQYDYTSVNFDGVTYWIR